MARPIKEGLDYFPMDVSVFSDRKVRVLQAHYGAEGIAVFLYVLCEIYRNGYYSEAESDFMDCAAMELGLDPETMEEIIGFCCKRSLFDEGLFKAYHVLTSAGVQLRFQEVCKSRRRKTEVDGRFWLLSPKETCSNISVAGKEGFYGNNPDYSGKNYIKERKGNESKENESKENESKENENKVNENKENENKGNENKGNEIKANESKAEKGPAYSDLLNGYYNYDGFSGIPDCGEAPYGGIEDPELCFGENNCSPEYCHSSSSADEERKKLEEIYGEDEVALYKGKYRKWCDKRNAVPSVNPYPLISKWMEQDGVKRLSDRAEDNRSSFSVDEVMQSIIDSYNK